jgi:beta-glucanase (GH16 family)
MRVICWGLIAVFTTVAVGLVVLRQDASAQPAGADWKLVWSDEFDGPSIDRTKWDFDIGNGFYNYGNNTWISGWGNGELQYYSREPDNAFVKDGMLHIRVLKESYLGCGYTSAKLKTRKRDGSALFCQLYGRFEFRAKLPTGRGIWPALWMLPQEDKYGGWPRSGEIDIMEARGQDPNKVLGTLHFGSGWPANTHVSREYVLPRSGSSADFHVYALEWQPGRIRWLVDDQPYATQSFWWSSGKTSGAQGARPAKEADLYPWPAPFDRPFYLIMNVAVGGNFLGNPDRTTRFPAEMLVDYVRVYDKVGGYGATPPRGEGKLPFAAAP